MGLRNCLRVMQLKKFPIVIKYGFGQVVNDDKNKKDPNALTLMTSVLTSYLGSYRFHFLPLKDL